MILLNDVINKLIDKNFYKYQFIDSTLEKNIKLTVNNLFINLNNFDKNILFVLSKFLIDRISLNNNFVKNENYYNQWTQNNYRDIKSVILMLLPYIDDNPIKKNFKNMKNLSQILFNSNDKKISKRYLDIARNDLLKKEFKFSNFAIGLLHDNNDNILELENDKEKLIYTVIHHNFIGILNTLKIINGKLYVNWINTRPLSINNFKNKPIYNKTFEAVSKISSFSSSDNITFQKKMLKLELNYNGLYLGDFYNILRNNFYEDIKKIKWLI